MHSSTGSASLQAASPHHVATPAGIAPADASAPASHVLGQVLWSCPRAQPTLLLGGGFVVTLLGLAALFLFVGLLTEGNTGAGDLTFVGILVLSFTVPGAAMTMYALRVLGRREFLHIHSSGVSHEVDGQTRFVSYEGATVTYGPRGPTVSGADGTVIQFHTGFDNVSAGAVSTLDNCAKKPGSQRMAWPSSGGGRFRFARIKDKPFPVMGEGDVQLTPDGLMIAAAKPRVVVPLLLGGVGGVIGAILFAVLWTALDLGLGDTMRETKGIGWLGFFAFAASFGGVYALSRRLLGVKKSFLVPWPCVAKSNAPSEGQLTMHLHSHELRGQVTFIALDEGARAALEPLGRL